jgi:hypothetical protein
MKIELPTLPNAGAEGTSAFLIFREACICSIEEDGAAFEAKGLLLFAGICFCATGMEIAC